MEQPLPRRRYRLKLDLEADTLDEMEIALENIGRMAVRGELTKGFSAGYNSSYSYELDDAGEQITHESWKADVAEFVKRKRAEPR